jgi:3-isopropylmalate/(R)-2-methylmalate dehydratase small subunit
MEQLETVRGIAAPLMQINIDTDQIIPSRFMPRVLIPGGLREGLFAEWRLTPEGADRPEFILNREPYTRAPFLLAGRNFGCGSSREQAPKALRQWGFRVVVAPSFGEIFYGNCFRNGILPVVLPEAVVEAMAAAALADGAGAVLAVDLHRDLLTDAQGVEHSFTSPARLRRMLLAGMDEIDLTMTLAADMAAYRARDEKERAWSYGCVQGPDSSNRTA